jgi:hypothetical protein
MQPSDREIARRLAQIGPDVPSHGLGYLTTMPSTENQPLTRTQSQETLR